MHPEHNHKIGHSCEHCGVEHKSRITTVEELTGMILAAAVKAASVLQTTDRKAKFDMRDHPAFQELDSAVFSLIVSASDTPLEYTNTLYGLIGNISGDNQIAAKLLFFSAMRMSEKKAVVENEEDRRAADEHREPRHLLEVLVGLNPSQIPVQGSPS